MFKVMIVDDEINVRRGLQKIIDWNSLGFEIIAEAKDGIDALAQYKENHADLVITDICMPQMNGLDLLAELKALNPDIEIIILSGYPDFNYAKFAMDNNVFSYILKPLETEEFIKTLKNVHIKMSEREAKSKEFFFSSLMQINQPTEHEILSLSQKCGYNPRKSDYILCVMQQDSVNGNSNNVSDNLYSDVLKNFKNYDALFLPGEKYITMLIYFSTDRALDFIKNSFMKLQQDFSEETGLSLTIGVSRVKNNLLKIQDAHLEAVYALSQKIIKGYGTVIYYISDNGSLSDTSTSTTVYITRNELNSIFTGLKTFNKSMVTDVIDNFFERCKKLESIDVMRIKNNVSELAIQIIHFSMPHTENLRIIYGEIPQPITDIQNMTLLTEIQEYINGIVNKIFTHPELRSIQKYSSIVQKAYLYIMTNYHLSIGIDDIADELHIDKNHLMKIFKAETNETINGFLTRHRINIAVDLIKEGEYLIQDIAALVGYSEAKYFSKVFKKVTGYVPTDYINIIKGDDK